MQVKLALKQPTTLRLKFQLGATGPSGTVAVGTTTTGAAGSNASVTNTGTPESAVLNFTIPRGNPGTAATVAVGTTTTGAAGSNASVTNSGTSSAAVLDFTVPRGNTGAPATITVGTVTTGAAGSSATVTNVGTSGAAVFDFSIPRGNTGTAATVAVGTVTTGAAGSSATVTNVGTSGAAVFDFSIPRGNTGTAATVAVGTVTTGAAGGSATVTNVGTSSAAVFDFSIPRGTPGTALARGQIAGLTLSNNATDAVNDIDIAPGICRDSANTVDLILASAITKRLDAAWAVGSGNGGLDTGSKANDASYHMHLIQRTSDGLIDALFSGSATSPTMPSGWTAPRRLGGVTTDGSGAIRPFIQIGNDFWYKDNVIANASISTSTTPVLQVLQVPAGVKCKARLAALASGGAAGLVLMRDPDLGVPTVDPNFGDWRRDGVNNLGFVHEVWTNTARQIYCGDSGSGGGALNIRVRGWVDLRDEFA